MSDERRVDRLPVDEPELVLLGSGVSLGPVRSPRVQAMLECMAVLVLPSPDTQESPDARSEG